MNMFVPKSILIFLLALIIFGAGVFVGRDVEVKPQQASQQQKEDVVKVARVIDGDTIELENGEHLRYIGIDAPETSDPRKPVQCFGVQAAKENRELVEGKMVRLEKDISERDRYGRLLRYVYVGDIFVNLELVKQGFAKVATYPPDVKYQSEFLAVEREAMEGKRGLWGSCPPKEEQTKERKERKEKKESGRIKGGETYAFSGCPFYDRFRIFGGAAAIEAIRKKWFCGFEFNKKLLPIR